MWWTPEGERVLRGAEWALVRAGVEALWDEIEEGIADPDLGPAVTGVGTFDRFSPSQQLAVLAHVARALSDESVPRRELTAYAEAAVAAVFAHLRTGVEMEIEWARGPDVGPGSDASDRFFLRSLTLAAYREVAAGEEETGGSETPVEAGDDDDDEGPWAPPEVTSSDLGPWEDLIECLSNRILWEDGDYDMADEFLDLDPDEARTRMGLMRIEADYYTAIPPDPSDAELDGVRETLRALCGRGGPP